MPWAEAAASCLPKSEGIHKTLDALGQFQARALEERMIALVWFRACEVLDWIEAKAPPANVSGKWGLLASLSDLSWARVLDWLSRGRPLSLIALDALAECIPGQGRPAFVRELGPALADRADRSAICAALLQHMTADDVPRVSNQCHFVIEHIAELRSA